MAFSEGDHTTEVLADKLERLFTDVITGSGLGVEEDGIPDHLALFCVNDIELGLERLRVVNWLTKDVVDVFRKLPTDDDESGLLGSPFEPQGVPFKLLATDLLERPYTFGSEDGEVEILTLHFEVMPQRLRRWAPISDSTYTEASGDLGSVEYETIDEEIRDMLGLEALSSMVTLSPEMFQD